MTDVRNSPSGQIKTVTGGSGIVPPAGQIDGTETDPLIVGLTDSDGAEFPIGTLPNGGWLRQLGGEVRGRTIMTGDVINDSPIGEEEDSLNGVLVFLSNTDGILNVSDVPGDTTSDALDYLFNNSGAFAPIQNTLYLDPASALDPDGSIKAPFTLFSSVLATIASSGEGSWEIVLPNQAITTGTISSSLGDVVLVVLQGMDRIASDIGTWEYSGPTGIAWTYRNLKATNITHGSGGDTGKLVLENVDISNHLDLAAGGSWSTVNILNCTIALIEASSVDAVFRCLDSTLGIDGGSSALESITSGYFENCTVAGNGFATANTVYSGCRFNAAAILSNNGTLRFLGCTFGASVHINNDSTFDMDAESEFSWLSNGGIFDANKTIHSLSIGQGDAFPAVNANQSVDFTGRTRYVLYATRLSASRDFTIAATGGVGLQQFVIDSYNTSGFNLVVKFSVTTLATIGNGNARYTFQLDAAGTTLTLVSVKKLA
jgi:hypothetical protein